jgi:lipoprotein-anchoring transpeptidase ErfK/SrfK
MQRAAFIGLGATAAAVLVFVVAILVVDGARSNDVIADGVRIGTVDVGGLDRGEARALLQRKLARSVDKRIAVKFRGQHFVLRPDVPRARLDAGASADAALRRSNAGNPFSRVLGGADPSGTVTPRVSFSRTAVDEFAARIARRVNRDARDADIDWRDGKLDRTRARNGVEVQRSSFVAKLVGVITNPGAERTVEVPVKTTERPDRNLNDLAKRYPTVIAVDRDATTLRLYKNLQLAKRYKIAVGKAGAETAAGRYKIVEKIVNPPWRAPEKAWAGDLAGKTIPPNDPRNPLEARWMGFYDGQGIHGTDDIASLGTAASRGCIRMSVPAVKELYAKVKIGTPLFLQ